MTITSLSKRMCVAINFADHETYVLITIKTYIFERLFVEIFKTNVFVMFLNLYWKHIRMLCTETCATSISGVFTILKVRHSAEQNLIYLR